MSKVRLGKSARYKVQRRLGTELPGLGKPGALERRPYPPGENGNKRRKYSDYALRLEEKQKIRVHYCLREEQLRRFIRNSKQGSSTNWVNKLMGLLERRLDNLVFRLGFAPSIRSARQLVSHGHVLVDGKAVTVGSFVVPQNSKVGLTEKGRMNQIVLQASKAPRLEVPDYLRKEQENGGDIGVVQAMPGTEHVPFQFDAGLFTEYYAARKA
jgi:small subunit ribosomal protein S4